MPPVLDEILHHARASVAPLRARRRELERAAAEVSDPPSFYAALRGGRLALIAEVKRRSPSAGAINEGLDPAGRAAQYAGAGAAAISVLTEGPHFGGSLDDLRRVRDAVEVPLLRKDFLLDECQLLEARAAGAAAVLLIARVLPPARLRELVAFARDVGLGALVETHTEREVDVALTAEADILGVNARDLDTFALDPEGAWRLLAAVPASHVAVAESAMHTAEDAARAAAAGADAVLIGTALSAAADPAALVRQVVEVPRRGR